MSSDLAERLDAYLDGFLLPEPRRRIEARLENDEGAQRLLASVLAARAVRELAERDAPVDLGHPEVCPRVQKQIPWFLKGVLAPGAQLGVEAHMRGCATCAAFKDGLVIGRASQSFWGPMVAGAFGVGSIWLTLALAF